MKQLIIIFAVTVIAGSANAQVKSLDLSSFKVEKKSYWGNVNTQVEVAPAFVFTDLKVVTLPLDQMPCMAPAKTLVAQMPYKKLILEVNGIPNALALEKKNVLDKISP